MRAYSDLVTPAASPPPPSPAERLARAEGTAVYPAVALALTLFFAALAVNTNGLSGAIMAGLTAASAGVSLRYPVPAGIAISALLTLPLVDVSLSPGPAVLASPVVVSVLAAQRRVLIAILMGTWHLVAIILLTVWNSAEPTVLSVLTRSLFWYLVLMAAYFFGVWVRRLHERITEEETRRVVDLADQRRALARELHDTAVRATTEVVLFAETAGQRTGIDPIDAREFARISRTARLATDELRTLVESLRHDDGLSPTLEELPVRVATWSDALAAASDRLTSAGFHVGLSEEAEAPVPAQLTPVLSRALAEVVANVIRHGDRSVPVAVMSSVTAEDMDLLVANGVASDPVPGLRGGTGLAGIRERLALVHGHLDTQQDGTRFVTHLSIPLPTAPPRKDTT